MKYAFYPKWYTHTEDINREKIVKTNLMLFLFFIILIILEISMEIKKINSLETKINDQLQLYNIEVKKEQEKISESVGIEQDFQRVYEFISNNNLCLDSMKINDEKINIVFEILNKSHYGKIVNLIEKDFKIITISSPIDFNDTFLIYVEIEKNEDI